jgi:hypothetical protein
MYIIEATNLEEAEIIADMLLKKVDKVMFSGIDLIGVESISISDDPDDLENVSIILGLAIGKFAVINYYPREADCRLSVMTIGGERFLNISVKSLDLSNEKVSDANAAI